MGITFLIARIAFVAGFLMSGIYKLTGISATAAAIQTRLTLPAGVSDLATRAQTATGMTPYELLAIAAGVIEIIFPLMIIFNVLTRFSALVMLVYVAVITCFVYDFWNLTDTAAQTLNMTLALKNLSIMGGFLMLIVLGAWYPGVQDEDDYPA